MLYVDDALPIFLLYSWDRWRDVGGSLTRRTFVCDAFAGGICTPWFHYYAAFA